LTLLLPLGHTFCASCRRIVQSVSACFFSDTWAVAMSGLMGADEDDAGAVGAVGAVGGVGGGGGGGGGGGAALDGSKRGADVEKETPSGSRTTRGAHGGRAARVDSPRLSAEAAADTDNTRALDGRRTRELLATALSVNPHAVRDARRPVRFMVCQQETRAISTLKRGRDGPHGSRRVLAFYTPRNEACRSTLPGVVASRKSQVAPVESRVERGARFVRLVMVMVME
jgi:hypothetical protein